jgi:SAM-dependent methyltransferase
MQFNLYSQYYDLIYNTKDYKAEAEKVISKLGKQSRNILELGCGSGGHAAILSKNGYSVLGIDLSSSMVEIANGKAIPNFNAIEGNISDFQLNKKFDVVISMFHVISYLNENDEVISCFKNVNEHLDQGGLFIFDFWFTPAVYHQGFERRIKEFENDQIRVKRESSTILELKKNVAKVGFEIWVKSKHSDQSQRIVEQHPMRFFSIPEIELFAQLTGFEVIEFFHLDSDSKPSLNTWAITAKLKKI